MSQTNQNEDEDERLVVPGGGPACRVSGLIRGNTVAVDSGTRRASGEPHGGGQNAREAGRHRYPALIGRMARAETAADRLDSFLYV